MLIAVDFHCHIAAEHRAALTIDALSNNQITFAPAASELLAVVTDRAEDGEFERLISRIPQPCEIVDGETFRCRSSTNRPVTVLRGWQHATAERLELHVLAASGVRLPEGLRASEYIEEYMLKRSLPLALPWGFGKWLGGRGRLLRQLCERFPDLILSDSAMRPLLFREPLFAANCGMPVIGGSDPLPFRGEEARAGAVLTLIECEYDPGHPANSLRTVLRNIRERHIRADLVGGRRGVLSAAVGTARCILGL